MNTVVLAVLSFNFFYKFAILFHVKACGRPDRPFLKLLGRFVINLIYCYKHKFIAKYKL